MVVFVESLSIMPVQAFGKAEAKVQTNDCFKIIDAVEAVTE